MQQLADGGPAGPGDASCRSTSSAARSAPATPTAASTTRTTRCRSPSASPSRAASSAASAPLQGDYGALNVNSQTGAGGRERRHPGRRHARRVRHDHARLGRRRPDGHRLSQLFRRRRPGCALVLTAGSQAPNAGTTRRLRATPSVAQEPTCGLDDGVLTTRRRKRASRPTRSPILRAFREGYIPCSEVGEPWPDSFRSTSAFRATSSGTERRCAPPVWKESVRGRRRVRKLNIDGDQQGDLRRPRGRAPRRLRLPD